MSEKVHVDTIPDFKIRDSIAHIAIEGREVLAMPLRIFRATYAKAGRTLAKHDARSAQVIPMRERRR